VWKDRLASGPLKLQEPLCGRWADVKAGVRKSAITQVLWVHIDVA
jgi:hypothetical protein